MATFTFLNTSNGTFAGTAGDDVFIWPTTNGSIDSGDTFFGGAGNDTLRLDSAVSLNFSGASASQWMAGIERITVNNTGVGNSITIGATAGAPEGGVITMLGGVGNDVFNIAARAVGYNGIFESAGGNDLFLGGGGADTFRPGTGNDTFSGGGGPDMVEFAQSSLLGTQPFNGADSLIGGSGLDTLRFTGDAAQGVVLTVYLQAPLIESFEVIDLTGYSGPSNVAMFSSYTANGDVTVLGGTGGDTVFGGSSVATRFVSVFEGGAGNDLYETITGTNLFRPGSGADSLRGGDGADAVEMAVADLDLLDSFTVDPAGFGVVRFTAGGVLTQVLANRLTGFERLELGPAGVAITLQGLPAMSGPDAALAVYDFVPVFGGTGRDRIDATPLGTAPVVIHGGADNDTITGTTFVLTMNGGEKSTDTLHGDDGNDLILGGAGRDSISGGAGNDTIDGGAGNEGDGTGLFNLLSGGGGNDRILLGAGNDWFILDDLESGQDSVFGGIGDDIIDIASGSQIGDDLLAGGTGADTLLAFYINDPLILGATATDRFSGFESILLPGYAATSLVITDSLAETAETPLQIVSTPVGARTLMLDASTVTDTGIVIFRADDIAVPNALTADTLIGGGGADTMTRFGGADLVMTGGGDDLVITPFPGAAPDPAKLDGGAGIDTLRALGAISSAGLSFATLTGFEIIELAGDGPNAISFVAGGLPAGGAVEIRGGSDADILDASALATGARFLGRAGDDILTGGSAADLLDAGVGADLVVGGGGNDTVHFADWAGDDIADGGTGIDRLDLSLGNALVPAGLLTSFAGFEALTLDMAGARVVLPGTFATTVGTGVFTVDLNTTAGAPGSAFRAQAVSNRLDIFGDAGMEAILGGRGADTIRDGGSADRIQGHLGADRIVLSDDGAADRVAFGNFFDGSFDIAAPANQGTLAQADTVIGFAGAGDPDNVLEFTRAAFGGLGAKSVVTTLAAGANLDLSTSGAFIVNAAHPVAGSFADRAAINTAFASKVLGGDAGNGAFVIARGPGGTDAAVYYIGDLDNLPGLSDQDLLVLLAVLVAPGAITANEILLA